MSSSYLHRTNSSGSGTTATVSMWVKQNQVVSDGGLAQFLTDTNNFIGLYSNPTVKFRTNISGSTAQGDKATLIKNRDPAAWYHYVFVFDTTNGTPGDRMRLWINGVRVTDAQLDTDIDPSSSYSFTPLVSGQFQLNRYNVNTTYSDHEYSHLHYTDGYAYDASTFGEFDATSGIWKIKTGPSVTYGTNGFFLKFEDRTNLDLDSGTNTFTDFTTVGTITPTYDNPSNNFCTGNPLDAQAANINYTTGNNTIYDQNSTWRSAYGTLGDNTAKYYFETKIVGASGNWWVGFCDADQVSSTDAKFVAATRGYGVNSAGNRGNSGSEASWTGEIATAQNEVVMVAIDMVNGKIYFGSEGVWMASGDPTSGSTGTGAAYSITTGKVYLPAFSFYSTTAGVAPNFGNGYFGTTAITSAGTNASGIGEFEFDVPTGYTALSTKGLNN